MPVGQKDSLSGAIDHEDDARALKQQVLPSQHVLAFARQFAYF